MHTIINVVPMKDYHLQLEFNDGTKRLYDVTQLFTQFPQMQDLKDINLFKSVQLDPGGYGVSWNDDLDISSDSLYELSQEIDT